MSVRARLAAMKLEKAEKKAADEAERNKKTVVTKRNIFARMGSNSESKPKQFFFDEEDAPRSSHRRSNSERSTWSAGSSPPPGREASDTLDLTVVDEEEDAELPEMKHFERPKIQTRRRISTDIRHRIQDNSASMKSVRPDSPSVKRASLNTEEATAAVEEVEYADTGEYDDSVPEWYYVDDSNETQGPYDGRTMDSWEEAGYLVDKVCSCWRFMDGAWITIEDAKVYLLSDTVVEEEEVAEVAEVAEEIPVEPEEIPVEPEEIPVAPEVASEDVIVTTKPAVVPASAATPTVLSTSKSSGPAKISKLPVTSKTTPLLNKATKTTKTTKTTTATTKNKNVASTPMSSDGGGEASTFRKNLRRKSIEIRDKAKKNIPLRSLAELLALLSLGRNVELYDVAVLAVDLQEQLKDSTATIATLQKKLAANNKNESSSTTSTTHATTTTSITSGTSKTSKTSKKSSTPSTPSTKSITKTKNVIDTKTTSTEDLADTDLVVIRDHQGNEIRIHGDGRVRISSKRSVSFVAPPPSPDMTSFDLKTKENITELWNAVNECLNTAKSIKGGIDKGIDKGIIDATIRSKKKTPLSATKEQTKSPPTSKRLQSFRSTTKGKDKNWTFFFRKAGEKTKQIGSPLAFDHSDTQRLQDALVEAELSQPMYTKGSIQQNDEKGARETKLEADRLLKSPPPLKVSDGGGENSSFRKKLRRQSMAIKSKLPARKKSIGEQYGRIGKGSKITKGPPPGAKTAGGTKPKKLETTKE